MALWVSSVQSCPRNERTTAQPTSMDLQSDMGSRPLLGATQLYLGLTCGTDLEEKSQCLKVILRFTAKIRAYYQ